VGAESSGSAVIVDGQIELRARTPFDEHGGSHTSPERGRDRRKPTINPAGAFQSLVINKQQQQGQQ